MTEQHNLFLEIKVKIKNSLKIIKLVKIPLFILLILSSSIAWIFFNQMPPTPSELYIVSTFVGNPYEVNIRVEKRHFNISDNEIHIQLEGELALSKDRRITKSERALSSEDDVCFGFSAFVWTQKPKFIYYGELMSNKDNFLNLKEKYNIFEREGVGYKYITRIPIEEIPEDYYPFSLEIHFSSPRLEDETYISIIPQFFENNIDEAKNFGTMQLNIPKKYTIKGSSCDTREGSNELLGDIKSFVECDYEMNKQFWFHIGKKETKIWPYILAVIIFVNSCCIAWIQHILAEKSIKEILKQNEEILRNTEEILWKYRQEKNN